MGENVEDFLAHFGVKGMKWGVRKSSTQKIRDFRKKGLGPNQLRKENKRVQELGGGVKGTVKARRELIDQGKLSKEQARKGRNKFVRNVAVGTAVAAGAGFLAARLVTNGGKSISSLSQPSHQVFSARGKDFVLEYGDKLYPSLAKELFG